MSRSSDLSDAAMKILSDPGPIEAPCDPQQYTALARIAKNPANRLVVSLGGGSVPGLVGNCALVSLLEELGISTEVDEVWGTSAGAVVGGCWASGATPNDILKAIDNLNRSGSVEVAKWTIITRLLRMIIMPRHRKLENLPDGLIKGNAFKAEIGKTLRVENIEDCPRRFRAIACTDDGHARKIVISRGPLVRALSASMCIPGVAPPEPSWQGEEFGYFDGGVVEKTPLLSIVEDHLRRQKENRLFVLCTHFGNDARINTPRGFLQRFLSTMHRMEDRIWAYQVEEAKKVEGTKFVVLNPHMTEGGMFDFSKARLNYLWARREFKEQLSNARLGLRFATT